MLRGWMLPGWMQREWMQHERLHLCVAHRLILHVYEEMLVSEYALKAQDLLSLPSVPRIAAEGRGVMLTEKLTMGHYAQRYRDPKDGVLHLSLLLESAAAESTRVGAPDEQSERRRPDKRSAPHRAQRSTQLKANRRRLAGTGGIGGGERSAIRASRAADGAVASVT
jgi:hypothetical protein